MEDRGRLLRIGLIGIAVFIVFIGVWFGFIRKSAEPEDQSITEITLERGDASMTLTRGGTLTVRIPEGVFQQQWDEERVRAFFSRFESEDFSQFSIYGQDVEGYVLTITRGDGSQVSYVIPFFEFDIPLPDVIEELIDILEEITTISLTPTSVAFPTSFIPTYGAGPSPTVPVPPSTPIPTQPPSGGGPQTQQPFECDFFDPNLKPDIISETACTPE